MIKLHSPVNEAELALIESILMGEGIPYYVHNNYLGTLRIGPPIELFNKKTIMVPPDFEERARELLADFLEKTAEPQVEWTKYSILDKLRIVAEFLIFGWFIPGKRCNKNGLR